MLNSGQETVDSQIVFCPDLHTELIINNVLFFTNSMIRVTLLFFIYFLDRMADIMKKELDITDFEMTSTVEDTCFVNIPEDEIKMENIEVKGKFKN